MLEIEMSRGDLETREFEVRMVSSSGESVLYTEPIDEIFLTVKKNWYEEAYKFQKRLTTMGIVCVSPGVYQFTIEPEDTDGLAFGDYVFDIELYNAGELKKTFKGILKVGTESTYACNEVSE